MTTVILHIEASTDICSVALSQDGHVFFERTDRNERSHAKVLAPFVEEALKNADNQEQRQRNGKIFDDLLEGSHLISTPPNMHVPVI